NGNFISFRTGNCSINVNELKVYRSRYPSVTVTMGDNTKDIRYQNPNPTTFGAKIKSIVVDANNNLSAIAYHDLNIDWTAPSSVSVNDGTSNDVDTIFDNTTASAVWTTSNDPNSGISEYWYALGTSPGATDIVNWTNNGANTNLTVSGLSLNNGSIYYFSVKSKNGADLWSNISSSDGFVVLATNILDNNNKSFVNIYPNPFTENINIVFVHLFSGTVSLTDVTGRIILSENVNRVSEHNLKGLSNLKSGIYIIQLKETNGSTHCVSMMRR
ncbi:MAG: T9SS type A sorting domain-containing protein, partial [Bacteroidetes bacterium]|nr:T9SS type A sorting domain-containing protein [Bacteroidota bacterium]